VPRVALQYKSRIDSYKVLKSNISGFQDIVAKIINSRNNLKNHNEMHLSFENTTSKCPFCGNYKSSISDLWIAYDEQTIFFDGLKDEALEELNIIIDALNDGFIKECKSKSIYFIEKYERFTDLLPALG